MKMYITINNIKGEKRIDLSYSIQNFDPDKEIAVIRMLSNNVKYEILKLRAAMGPISDTKKLIPKGTYAGRELLSMLEGIVELNQFEVDDQVIKKDKLKGITEMTLNLDELDNSDNVFKKMYITINDIIGEKTIDLSYPIQNFDSSKEVAVISMFSNNIQYKVTETFNLKLIGNREK